jgi:beta-phosphoglucomutase-like phosphatase (HAD superfamily)
MKKYKTYIFHCDGVLLNSNIFKTQAFYEAAKKYGEKNAKDFIEYHIKNGGVSRYEKFSYFLSQIFKNQWAESDI